MLEHIRLGCWLALGWGAGGGPRQLLLQRAGSSDFSKGTGQAGGLKANRGRVWLLHSSNRANRRRPSMFAFVRDSLPVTRGR